MDQAETRQAGTGRSFANSTIIATVLAIHRHQSKHMFQCVVDANLALAHVLWAK